MWRSSLNDQLKDKSQQEAGDSDTPPVKKRTKKLDSDRSEKSTASVEVMDYNDSDAMSIDFTEEPSPSNIVNYNNQAFYFGQQPQRECDLSSISNNYGNQVFYFGQQQQQPPQNPVHEQSQEKSN